MAPAPDPVARPEALCAANSDSTAFTAATGTTGSGSAPRKARMADTNACPAIEAGNSDPVSRHLSIPIHENGLASHHGYSISNRITLSYLIFKESLSHHHLRTVVVWSSRGTSGAGNSSPGGNRLTASSGSCSAPLLITASTSRHNSFGIPSRAPYRPRVSIESVLSCKCRKSCIHSAFTKWRSIIGIVNAATH